MNASRGTAARISPPNNVIIAADPCAAEHLARQALVSAGAKVTTLVCWRVLQDFGSEVALLLGEMVSCATRASRVAELNQHFGVDRTTIHHRLRRQNLPAPGVLLMWCRILVATFLVQDGHTTVNAAARLLQFHSAAALRNLTKSYTGHPLSTLIERGGFPHVLDCFMYVLQDEQRRRVITAPPTR